MSSADDPMFHFRTDFGNFPSEHEQNSGTCSVVGDGDVGELVVVLVATTTTLGLYVFDLLPSDSGTRLEFAMGLDWWSWRGDL